MEKQKLKGMVFAALFAALTGAVAWFKIPLPFTPVPITLQTLMVLLSGAMLGAYYGALAMIIYLIMGSIGFPVFAGGSSGFGAILGPTGGYLLSYPVAAFVIGTILSKKNINNFLKYISYFIVFGMIILVLIDAVFKIGLMRLWDTSTKSYVSMVSLITENQRALLIITGLLLALAFMLMLLYSRKIKSFSIEMLLAMFTGTLIIYLMGAVQGKLVTGLPWNAIFVGWVLPFIVGDTIKLLLAAYIAKSVDMKRYMGKK